MKTRKRSVKKAVCWSVAILAVIPLLARAEGDLKPTEPEETVKEEQPQWMGKYCMSMFTRARTAKTVGKGHLSLALKFQYNDYDKVMDSSDCYCSLGDDSKSTYNMVATAK